MTDPTLRTLLLVVLALPAAAGVFAALLGPRRGDTVRGLALVATLATLVLTAVLVAPVARHLAARPTGTTFVPEVVPGDPGTRTGAPSHKTTWDLVPLSLGEKPQAIQFYVGLDGLNVWLVALTAVMMPLVVLVSWNTVRERANEYYGWLLVLQTGMTGVFLSFDLILFYAFFELTLVPLLFLVGVFGVGPLKREAARKLFLYTLAGSLITLLGMIGVVGACYSKTGVLTFSIPELVETVGRQIAQSRGDAQLAGYWHSAQVSFFLAMLVGFAVKTPLVPLHTWLPVAYGEAPAGVTAILAGVLAKMGTYGMVRLCLPLAPDAAVSIGVPLVGALAIVGIIYGAFCAFAYTRGDIKSLVAYSSISHLGFCVLGLFALNQAGLTGGVLHMVNHGVSTGAMFLLVGLIAAKFGTRNAAELGGLADRAHVLALCMVTVSLASVGLPGLNNFVSEMLMMGGVVSVGEQSGVPSRLGVVFVAAGAAGIVLGAWYTISMLRNVFFGEVRSPDGTEHAEDVTGPEFFAVVPATLLCLVLGLFPQPVIDAIKPDAKVVADIADAARGRASAPLAVAAVDRNPE